MFELARVTSPFERRDPGWCDWSAATVPNPTGHIKRANQATPSHWLPQGIRLLFPNSRVSKRAPSTCSSQSTCFPFPTAYRVERSVLLPYQLFALLFNPGPSCMAGQSNDTAEQTPSSCLARFCLATVFLSLFLELDFLPIFFPKKCGKGGSSGTN